MENAKLRFKIFLTTGLLLLLPMFSFADVGQRRDEIKKQLDATIAISDELIDKMRDLVQRISLNRDTGDEAKLMLAKAVRALEDANERTNTKLPRLAKLVLFSARPIQTVKDFRKEVDEIKAEIIFAHKLVVETINLIKTRKEVVDDVD